ncbi:MAG: hypothetical protein JWN29_3011 [Acidimicrobiales bacterium]|nr:hypothetical protein [Acidimicrobiales bacterium]
MADDRFVVLGLARPRAEWFRSVAQWATSAAIPAEFLKCVSVEELRARLAAGRAYSAALLDGSLSTVDRDLVETAREAGCVVLIVDDGRVGRDWAALGAAAVLPPSVSREALLDALATHATMVGRATAASLDEGLGFEVPLAFGTVAAVCGPGGTGASTVAVALAQGLGTAGTHGDVLLADFALNAEQAMLHDVRDVVPGVQELVEAHRSRRPTEEELLSLTFHVLERRYHLLLGLRRARYWSTLRPRSFEAAFDSLRRRFGVVVCDVTADVEGEDEGGSTDVEERNLLARTAVRSADVVFAVGLPGAKGVHALVRVLADLAGVGVPAGRVVPVLNQAPRQPSARAELTAALSDLAGPAMGGGRTVAPVFLPARRVEEAMRDVVSIPAPLPAVLAGAFEATLTRLGPALAPAAEEPELVTPGSLGGGYDEERA